MEHPKISKNHFSSQNMLSVFADILRKKFWGTEGKSTRSLGCISTRVLVRTIIQWNGILYVTKQTIKEKHTKIAVALGSRQLNKDCSLSPCVAKSPNTVCILAAMILNRSYLHLRTSPVFLDGIGSNSSSSSSSFVV